MNFGEETAEQERSELTKYFVHTDYWRQIVTGRSDIIFGTKGAGKSAIYLLIQDQKDQLADTDIITINAENPSGQTAFRQLVADPPTSEAEFRNLWKAYFCVLALNALRSLGPLSRPAKRVADALKESGLGGPNSAPLETIVKNVIAYARKYTNPKAAEVGISFDAVGNVKAVIPKLTFEEPSDAARKEGAISVDEAIRTVNGALEARGKRLWVLLDRLDVAFNQSDELETNALRALFRVYNDLMDSPQIILKVFLRDDIWKRVVEGGFREASHITRQVTLDWKRGDLLNLICRRALSNDVVVQRYAVRPSEVLGDAAKQEELFYRIFPDQVERGKAKTSTLEWIMSRTKDGKNDAVPREIIGLLNQAVVEQIRSLERGDPPPEGERLFSGAAIKAALPAVSRKRLDQTLYAEYPDMKARIETLRGKHTEQTLETLMDLWGFKQPRAAQRIVDRLVDIGFFESREKTLWVPFLYRHALEMVQGKAP